MGNQGTDHHKLPTHVVVLESVTVQDQIEPVPRENLPDGRLEPKKRNWSQTGLLGECLLSPQGCQRQADSESLVLISPRSPQWRGGSIRPRKCPMFQGGFL